jgi:magnesium-transporting ATPase (P-type)
LDTPLLLRAFGVLGLTEALIEMAAFLASMVAAGWRPHMKFPEGAAFLAASGAAFSAVVIGQMANAFACRSATRWPGAIGWTTNRPLLYAVIAELMLLLLFLFVGPLSSILGQNPPAGAGAAAAMFAFPAVLLVDAIHKYLRRRKQGYSFLL